MIRKLTYICFMLLIGMSVNAAVVTGRVTCAGEPVAGVSISDGNIVVQTDADGNYSLKSKLALEYVFMSVPSGYEVHADGIIPRFFKRISPDVKNAVADFELVRVDQKKCNIIVYNDIHLVGDKKEKDLEQARTGFFPDVIAEYEKLNDVPVYALTVGDMTSDNKWYTHNYALPEYLQEMSDFPVPVYHSMGNHDNDMRAGGGDFNSSSTFRKVVGPNYYSLNIGAYHIIVLDNIFYDNPFDENGIVKSARGYHTHLDDMQFKWLREDLKTVPTDTPIMIVAHAPFTRILGVENEEDVTKDGFTGGYYANDIVNLFRKFPSVHILTGHTHENYFAQIDDKVLEHNNIAVSGASWKTHSICGLNLIRDGVPGGYSVYTIDGDELSWYYKAVGFEKDECQFRAYDMNVVPSSFKGEVAANTIWVNVFNYDPLWKVVVRENGVEIPVKREFLTDPLYDAAVYDTKLGQGTFKAKPSNHMFTAQTSSPTSEVEIIVTDRFGHTYVEKMERPGYFGLDMKLGNK